MTQIEKTEAAGLLATWNTCLKTFAWQPAYAMATKSILSSNF